MMMTITIIWSRLKPLVKDKTINPFIGDDIKVDDIKFNKLVMAETFDKEVKLMLTIPLESLASQSFLLPIKGDGTRDRAKIIKIYDEHQKILGNEPDLTKLRNQSK